MKRRQIISMLEPSVPCPQDQPQTAADTQVWHCCTPSLVLGARFPARRRAARAYPAPTLHPPAVSSHPQQPFSDSNEGLPVGASRRAAAAIAQHRRAPGKGSVHGALSKAAPTAIAAMPATSPCTSGAMPAKRTSTACSKPRPKPGWEVSHQPEMNWPSPTRLC